MVPLRIMEKQILHSDSILVRGCSGIIRIFCLPPCSKSLLEFCLRRIRISINWMISVLDNLRSIDFLMTSILVDILWLKIANFAGVLPKPSNWMARLFTCVLQNSSKHVAKSSITSSIVVHITIVVSCIRPGHLCKKLAPWSSAEASSSSLFSPLPPKTSRSTPRSHTLTYSQNRTFPKQAENPDPVRRNLCRSELRSTPALRRRAQLSTSVDAQPWSRGISLQLFVISSYDSNN